MTRITLVRHGETDWNLSKRIQGSSDIPLNDTGRAQLRVTGDLLNRRRWDAIYSSPLSRATESADIIASAVGLDEIGLIPAVAERNYGDAEGLTGAEILARFPDGVTIPGRETRDEVVRRALPALLELAEQREGQSLLVVSHGGVISSLVRHVTNNALPGPNEIIPNGSAHNFVVHDGALRLDTLDQGAEDHDLFTAVVS